MITNKKEMMFSAINLFKELGYDNVTVQMICQKCGVTRGSFYHHFKNKEDLFFSWIENIEEPLYRENETLNAAGNLKSLLENYAKMLHDVGHDLMYQSFWTASVRGKSPLYCLFYREDIEVIVMLIEQAISDGDIKSDLSAQELSQIFFDAIIGACIRWHYNQLEKDFIEYFSEITFCILQI